MAEILHLDEMLITESLLLQRHQGEVEIHLVPDAIVTPSARDYLRLQGARVMQTSGARHVSNVGMGSRGHAGGTSSVAPRSTSATGTPIQEILPPGAEGGLLYRGRCDHPDRSYGCQTEEFGSGFVEPACCDACAAAGTNGGPACDCADCSADDDADQETLVQRLTDEIMSRLEQ